jgi:PAS domain S-box-containing protein
VGGPACHAGRLSRYHRAQAHGRRTESLRRRYRDLFENANDGIYILDGAGRIVSFNRKAEEITGYTLEEIRGQPYTILVSSGPERKKARRAFLKNMRGQPDKTELTIIRKDGREVILELSTRPIWQGGQIVGIQGIGRDITERKELERLKSDFISTVSHELRTPLTSIKGYVDLVLAGDVGPLTSEQKEFLTIASQNTTRLTELINDLLEIERLESGKIEFEFAELDLAEVLDNVARSLHVNAEQKGLELLTEIPSGLAGARGSRAPRPGLSQSLEQRDQVHSRRHGRTQRHTKKMTQSS